MCRGATIVAASLAVGTIAVAITMHAVYLLALLVAGGRCDVADGKRRSRPLSVSQRLAAGGASRFGAQLVTYPADAMRTLAQTRTGAKTLAELGMGTLISGCVTTSAFAFLVGAIQFSIFGTLQHTVLGALGASAVGALGSCLASVPQEVIKQRLVTGIYPDFGAAVQTIYATEGIRPRPEPEPEPEP